MGRWWRRTWFFPLHSETARPLEIPGATAAGGRGRVTTGVRFKVVSVWGIPWTPPPVLGIHLTLPPSHPHLDAGVVVLRRSTNGKGPSCASSQRRAGVISEAQSRGLIEKYLWRGHQCPFIIFASRILPGIYLLTSPKKSGGSLEITIAQSKDLPPNADLEGPLNEKDS